MTDNEIIKAWEKILATGDAPFGKHWGCSITTELAKDTFDMLNRQKAEIKEFTTLCEMQDKNMLEQKAEIERLQKAGDEAVNCFNRMETLYKIKCKELEVAKSKAIKEFAERLKQIIKNKRKNVDAVLAKTRYGECILAIDNLAREMTEQKE